MNTSERTLQEETGLQDQVWDTYLKGLLNHAYTPRQPVTKVEPTVEPTPKIAECTQAEAPPPDIIPAPSPPAIPPPEWSLESFQCLFFKLGEILLAAPLITLREVIKYERSVIKNLPGQPRWSSGIIDHRGEIINLIDPGSILMGSNYTMPDKNYRYIILTDTPGIGFLCHEFTDMSRLDPGSIRWYQNRIKRPWLAGIHKQKLCTVIDIERLLPNQSITNNDKQKRFII